jgi:hypothetical protein
MGKMVRNLVTVKDEGKGADMKRYVSSLGPPCRKLRSLVPC